MTHELTIIATLHAQEGRADALAARLHAMVRDTLQEAGCIAYDLHRAEHDPREFVLVEYWRDRAAIDLHDASAHMAAFKADLPALLDRPVSLQKLTPLVG